MLELPRLLLETSARSIESAAVCAGAAATADAAIANAITAAEGSAITIRASKLPRLLVLPRPLRFPLLPSPLRFPPVPTPPRSG